MKPTKTKKHEGKANGRRRTPADFQTIKIYRGSYDKLQTSIERLARNGWSSVGANREDSFTIANVIDEALAALLDRRALT